PPAPAGEELGHHLLEAAGGRLERLLERRGDLAIRPAHQRAELGDRLLQVLPLLGQLGHVLPRLGVLPLSQRVDGADLLAAAPEARELGLDLIAVGLAERLARGLELLAQRRAKPLELRGALITAIAELGCLDLRGRHRLARLPKLALEAELLLRALAKL